MSESQNSISGSDEQTRKQLPLQVGAMTLEQIALIFTHLPVDVTFVDDGNDVRFYSGGNNRIFERTPDIIGRNVLNCHSPDSVQIVFKIWFFGSCRGAPHMWG